MWNILNMLCIGVTQSDTKNQVTKWLERFENFTKFLMIVSESWKSRLVSSVYQTYQRRFADVITFALAFLFHEIHATKRSSPTHNQQTDPEKLVLNKLYAQSLKSIMIFFINIVEYARIKHTPAQLESHLSACRFIVQHVLVKSGGQHETQQLMRDITRFKQSDYEDFPECFYLDDWKVTFFKNNLIKEIVRQNFNWRVLQLYAQKRRAYALNFIETQKSNEETKHDILQRMQSETHEIIGELSAEEYERRNQVALINDNFIRNQANEW